MFMFPLAISVNLWMKGSVGNWKTIWLKRPYNFFKHQLTPMLIRIIFSIYSFLMWKKLPSLMVLTYNLSLCGWRQSPNPLFNYCQYPTIFYTHIQVLSMYQYISSLLVRNSLLYFQFGIVFCQYEH